MGRYLVLGSGFGGITAALTLREGLGAEHDVTLVDQRSEFVMGLAHLWALVGRRPLDLGRRPLSALSRHGVRVVRGHVDSIDTATRSVLVDQERLPYDRLVVALGADLAVDAIPGFSEGHNLYDARVVPALARTLETWPGGRLLLAIGGVPFRCPPAPYEAILLFHELFSNRGVQADLTLSTPEPRPLPIAPASCSADLQRFLAQAGVRYHPDHLPKAVDAGARVVRYANGASLPYDLLVVVPPHRAPPAVAQSPLAGKDGWIPVDPGTLRTSVDGVHAVGDVASIPLPVGRPLPKAGALAEAQARVVAANLVAEARGQEPRARFDGRGSCFIELGGGVATEVAGEFFDARGPQLTLAVPTEQARRDKEAFEGTRLAAWFGPG